MTCGGPESECIAWVLVLANVFGILLLLLSFILDEVGGIMMLLGPPCFGDRLDTSFEGRVWVGRELGLTFECTLVQDMAVPEPGAQGIGSLVSVSVIDFPFEG